MKRQRGGQAVQEREGGGVAVVVGDGAHGVSIHKDPELRGRLRRAVQAHSGRVAERDDRAFHDGQPAERACALGDDPGARSQQGRAQALVGGNVGECPALRPYQGENRAAQDREDSRHTASPPPLVQEDEARRRESRHRKNRRTFPGREDEKEEDDSESAQTGSQEIEEVDAMDVLLEPGESQGEAVASEKEGQKEDEISLEQVKPLARIP